MSHSESDRWADDLAPAAMTAVRTGRRIDVSPEAISAIPTLAELQVPPEILEAAAEIADASDVPGVESGKLEALVRLVVYHYLTLVCRKHTAGEILARCRPFPFVER